MSAIRNANRQTLLLPVGQVFNLTHEQTEGAAGLALYVSLTRMNGVGVVDVSSIARSLGIVSGEHDGVLFARVRAAIRVQE